MACSGARARRQGRLQGCRAETYERTDQRGDEPIRSYQPRPSAWLSARHVGTARILETPAWATSERPTDGPLASRYAKAERAAMTRQLVDGVQLVDEVQMTGRSQVR